MSNLRKPSRQGLASLYCLLRQSSGYSMRSRKYRRGQWECFHTTRDWRAADRSRAVVHRGSFPHAAYFPFPKAEARLSFFLVSLRNYSASLLLTLLGFFLLALQAVHTGPLPSSNQLLFSWRKSRSCVEFDIKCEQMSGKQYFDALTPNRTRQHSGSYQ